MNINIARFAYFVLNLNPNEKSFDKISTRKGSVEWIVSLTVLLFKKVLFYVSYDESSRLRPDVNIYLGAFLSKWSGLGSLIQDHWIMAPQRNQWICDHCDVPWSGVILDCRSRSRWPQRNTSLGQLQNSRFFFPISEGAECHKRNPQNTCS